MRSKDNAAAQRRPGAGQDAARRPERVAQPSLPARDDLPLYPIRTAALLAGVDARRIRSWESQYGLLAPARTRGGHRLFSQRDVARIRRIQALLDEGVSLQAIALLLAVEDPSGHGAAPASPRPSAS